MKKYIVIDRIGMSQGLSKRHINDAGYLVAPNSSVARSGILQYAAGSIGLSDRNPQELINVYRPPAEIRKIKEKFANMPVTQKHPDALEVTPGTARGLQVGNSGSNVTIVDLGDGEVEARTDIIVTDRESIDGILSGKTEELSVGYYSAYRQQSGTAPDGTPYEVIQHTLQPNHIALVDEGRCGAKCKVADQKPKTKEINTMDLVDVEINGRRYTVTADMAADLATLDAASEKEPTKKPDGYSAADMDDEDDKSVDMEDDDKATDEDDDDDKAVDDDDKEKFLEMINKKKKKTGDSLEAGVSYDIELPGGVVGTASKSVIQYISALDAKQSVPTVDHMEVAKVTSLATKILGSEFDIATCDSITAVKKAIISKVLPVVDTKSLKGEALSSLYNTAVLTFDSKGAQFNQDVNFLTGKTADGKTVDGAAAQNPFDSMLRLSASTKAADSAPGILSTSRTLKFIKVEGDK